MLNSSTACFWLKQNSHNKGEGGGARVDAGYAARGEPYRETYEFTGTTLQDYPLPGVLPLERGRILDGLARDLALHEPSAVCAAGMPTAEALAAAHKASDEIRARMIAMQEELDWEVYRLYGLVGEDLTYGGDDLPGLSWESARSRSRWRAPCGTANEETAWFSSSTGPHRSRRSRSTGRLHTVIWCSVGWN